MTSVTGESELGPGIASLVAKGETPHIGVHVLTEFVFCSRAGIVAHESDRDDPGQDLDAAPRLDYLPDFSVRELQDALQKTWSRIWRGLALGIAAGSLVFLVVLQAHWFLAVGVVGIALRPALRWLWSRFCDVATLQKRLRAAIDAQPNAPDATLMTTQPVNWWSLRKAGFSVLRPEDAYCDSDLRLSGRPWRILQKGSLRIPVFRKRSGENALYPQHRVRMAAYCNLIETCERAESPYGVVLFGDGCDGVTVPHSTGNRQAFHEALLQARQVVESLRSQDPGPDPPRSTACRECPLGRPVSYVRGQTSTVMYGDAAKPYLTRGSYRRLYHSPCGDRFVWVPPHERAKRKKLT